MRQCRLLLRPPPPPAVAAADLLLRKAGSLRWLGGAAKSSSEQLPSSSLRRPRLAPRSGGSASEPAPSKDERVQVESVAQGDAASQSCRHRFFAPRSASPSISILSAGEDAAAPSLPSWPPRGGRTVPRWHGTDHRRGGEDQWCEIKK